MKKIRYENYELLLSRKLKLLDTFNMGIGCHAKVGDGWLTTEGEEKCFKKARRFVCMASFSWVWSSIENYLMSPTKEMCSLLYLKRKIITDSLEILIYKKKWIVIEFFFSLIQSQWKCKYRIINRTYTLNSIMLSLVQLFWKHTWIGFNFTLILLSLTLDQKKVLGFIEKLPTNLRPEEVVPSHHIQHGD